MALALRHPGADRGGPVDLAAVPRILAVRADNIGDVVSTEPALRALRAAAPAARLDLLTSPAGAAVAPMIPALDGVLVAAATWQQLARTGSTGDGGGDDGVDDGAADAERELLGRLVDGDYDLLVVFTSFSQSPWPVAHLGLLAGIGTRVVQSREFGGAVATHWVTPPPDATHVVDRSLHLLAAIGVPDRGRAPALRVPAAADAACAGLGLPDRFAVLAPGASCPSRRYPPEGFGAAAALMAAAGLPVLVAGPQSEAALVARVVAAAGRADVRALPPVELPVLVAVLRRAAVAVTNNSGGLHLADAVGTPVAVAFAGTEPVDDLRPRSVASALLGRPVPCSPCRQLRCPYGHECLDVPPEDLARAATGLARVRPDLEEDRWLHAVPTP